MKKLLGFILLAGLSWTICQAAPNAAMLEHRLETETARQALGAQLLSAVKNSDLPQTKQLLAEIQQNPYACTTSDAYGNNVFHVAENEQIFALLWNQLPAVCTKQLLSQTNHIGETPFISYISYGKENRFLRYFPQTDLYKQLRRVSADLSAGGLYADVSKIKRDALIKQCSAAGQTMWQRANRFYNMASDVPSKQKMQRIKDMVSFAAPFLVR